MLAPPLSSSQMTPSNDDITNTKASISFTETGKQQQQQQQQQQQENVNRSKIGSFRKSTRLYGFAHYPTFHPSALACSGPVGVGIRGRSSSMDEQQQDAVVSFSLGAIAGPQGVMVFPVTTPQSPLLLLCLNSASAATATSPYSSSSYADPSFRSSSYSSSLSSSSSRISALCFQSTSTLNSPTDPSPAPHINSSSLLLAAAKGAGVLVWDVSGHSLSPLWGRLSVDPIPLMNPNTTSTATTTIAAPSNTITAAATTTTATTATAATTATTTTTTMNHHPNISKSNSNSYSNTNRRMITSVSWHPSPHNHHTCIAATTGACAVLWDIRQSDTIRPSSQQEYFTKPALRFASTGNSASSSSLIQLAMGEHFECAVLDRAGHLALYDLRMTTRSTSTSTTATATNTSSSSSNSSSSALVTIPAFQYAGIGLAHLPNRSLWNTHRNPHSSNATTSWLTWGLDRSPQQPENDPHNINAIVRIWTIGIPDSNTTPPSSCSVSHVLQPHQHASQQSSPLPYRLTAICTPRNLTCARVYSSEGGRFFPDALVTLSRVLRSAHCDWHWRADVWTLLPPLSRSSRSSSSSNEDGMEKDEPHLLNQMSTIASFEFGGGDGNGDGNGDGITGEGGWNNEIITSSMGSLCAAELASMTTVQYQDTNQSGNDSNSASSTMIQSTTTSRLLLSSLTEKGFILTHEIPEVTVSSKRKHPARHRILLKNTQSIDSEKIGSDRFENMSRTDFPEPFHHRNLCTSSSTSLQVFPFHYNDEPVRDAASAWTGNYQSNKSSSNQPVEPVSGVEYATADVTNTAAVASNNQMPVADRSFHSREDDPDAELQLKVSALSFDLELPVDSVPAAITKDGIGSGQSSLEEMLNNATHKTTKVSLREGSNQQDTGAAAREATSVRRRRIDTSCLPCPRLCGATFGSGTIGSLIVFQNGEVRKMWKWWEKKDPVRVAAVATPKTIGKLHNQEHGSSQKKNIILSTQRDFPRTLHDFMIMTSANTEAQWGDQEKAQEVHVDLDYGFGQTRTFFEDASDATTETGDEDMEAPPEKHLYDYFSCDSHHHTIRKNTERVDDFPEEFQAASKIVVEPFEPSTDILAPFVSISYKVAAISLSDQSVALALTLKMGAIGGRRLKDDAKEYRFVQQSTSNVRPRDISSRPDRNNNSMPKYRFLVPPSQPVRSSQSLQMPLTSLHQDEDDRGVHDGDYGVPPDKQNSMVFLQKMFTHHGKDGVSSSFANFITPHAEPRHLPGSKQWSDPAESITQVPNGEAIVFRPLSVQRRLGLYTRIPDRSFEDAYHIKEYWSEVVETCLCNAQICKELGESAKQSVWKLLAKAVDVRLSDTGSTMGRTLGTTLVSSFLQYYESQKDVQMLSTIVCVLQCRLSVSANNSDTTTLLRHLQHYSLLPPDQNDKYDTYIRRYSDLLFSWGACLVRTELNTHLFSSSPANDYASSNDKDMLHANFASSSKLDNTADMVLSHPPSPSPLINVVQHVFTCSRCSRETRGNNFCPYCQDFAFRCVICDESVRGLFITCERCGHGGHALHMQEWFSSHSVCPTGCGCLCGCFSGRNAILRPGPISSGFPSSRPNL